MKIVTVDWFYYLLAGAR